MRNKGNSVSDVTWMKYVERHAPDANQATIAAAAGVTASAVSRWKVSQPGPDAVAAFARHFGRPVLEAFIAAGFLTPEEAGEQPSAPVTLDAVDDESLLEVVRARMKGERKWSGDPSPEDRSGPAPGREYALTDQALTPDATDLPTRPAPNRQSPAAGQRRRSRQ